jgi:hypothetical protein
MIDELEALTGQPVDIKLGKKNYQARLASLYDLGQMESFRKKQLAAGESNELEIVLFLLVELIKDFTPDITIEKLGKSIGVGDVKDIPIALEQLGFTQPQTAISKTEVTGA